MVPAAKHALWLVAPAHVSVVLATHRSSGTQPSCEMHANGDDVSEVHDWEPLKHNWVVLPSGTPAVMCEYLSQHCEPNCPVADPGTHIADDDVIVL